MLRTQFVEFETGGRNFGRINGYVELTLVRGDLLIPGKPAIRHTLVTPSSFRASAGTLPGPPSPDW
jgi:hypothetical protein